MAKRSEKTTGTRARTRKAQSPEGREKQMIALAMDLAEQQIREGTASSQVISHFLKLGTEREKTERKILRLQEKLVKAKTDAYKSAAESSEMYRNAIAAMRKYSGNGDDDDYDEDDEYYED